MHIDDDMILGERIHGAGKFADHAKSAAMCGAQQ
jgi:hypothetical protein